MAVRVADPAPCAEVRLVLNEAVIRRMVGAQVDGANSLAA